MILVNITKDCFNCIILFLSIDDIYPFMETCKFFNNFIKEYKKRNKYYNLKQPCAYHITRSIQMIEWVKSHLKFKYTARISQFASRRDNFKLLKYLYKDGCIFDYNVLLEAIENENLKIIKWFLKKNIDVNDLCFYKACEKGNFDIIKILKKNNIHGDYNSLSCYYAVSGNNLIILNYLINEGYKFCVKSYIKAAKNGNIKILKYLLNLAQHDLSYPFFNTYVTSEAAKYGKLKTLKWLRKNGCNWDSFTPYLSSKNNKIKTLKWSLENGCQIYESTYQNLYKLHSLDIERNKCNIINDG